MIAFFIKNQRISIPPFLHYPSSCSLLKTNRDILSFCFIASFFLSAIAIRECYSKVNIVTNLKINLEHLVLLITKK